jgi:HAD superfamily hydrolase (TIGR01509 family)
MGKREFYLLEGMPISELALEVLKIKGFADAKNITNKDIQISENVAKRKKEVFREINEMPQPFAGVRELITNTLSGCTKAVVSGSSKEEVDIILNGIFVADAFNIIIDGDQFEGKGKPDPASYELALQRLNTKPSDAVIVENAPLGVQAANNAGIRCIVTLIYPTLMVWYQKTVCLEIQCQLETFYINGVTISLKVMCSSEIFRYLNTHALFIIHRRQSTRAKNNRFLF